MKKNIYLFSIAFISMFIFSCHSKDSDMGGGFNMSTLRIGLAVSENKKKVLEEYKPLFNYLSKKLGIPVEIIPSHTNKDLFEAFEKGRIDMAYFTANDFVRANVWNRAVPLVTKDIDAKTSTYFIARDDDPAQDLNGFSGKIFCYGPKSSISTYLMPRHYLEGEEIKPESFFGSVQYCETVSHTLSRIKHGSIDIGVADSKIIEAMYRDGLLSKKDIKVVWKTPAYISLVWTLNPYYTVAVQKKIKKVFLSLSRENETHREILELIGAERFIEVQLDDFSSLVKIMKN